MFKLSKRLFYFIVAIQLFLLVVVSLSIRQFIVTSNAINTSNHLLVITDTIGETLLNAETGQRGYLITGDTEYLHPYNYAYLTLPGQLQQFNSFASLINRQHPRVDRVNQLAQDKMVELQNTIKLVRDGSVQNAVDEVKTNKGKEIMEEIRVLLAEITTTQSNRIDVLASHLKLYGFAILSGLLAISGLGVAFVRRLPPEDGPNYSS